MSHFWISAAAESDKLRPKELECVESLMDILDRIFSMMSRLGLMEDVYANKERSTMCESIASDAEFVLEDRRPTPPELLAGFERKCALLSQDALDKQQFRMLVMEIEASGISSKRFSSFKSFGDAVRRASFDRLSKEFRFDRSPQSASSPTSPVLALASAPPTSPASPMSPSFSPPQSPTSSEGGGRPRQTAAERAAHLELVFDEADEDNSGTVSEWVRRQFAVTMSGFMT